MSRTGKYTGLVSSLTWTPPVGSPVTFTGVIGVKPIINDQLVEFTGDAATFATLLARVKGSRGIQLSGNDVSKFLRSFPSGPGTVAVTIADAVNTAGGAGSGALTYTLVNAMRQEASANHQNQSADSASVTYMGYSSDGSTDPLTIAEA